MLAEPEMALIDQLEPRAAVKQPGEFPRLLSIIAPDTDEAVSRKSFLQLLDLHRQCFLGPQQIRIVSLDRPKEHLAPMRPVVLAVLGGAVADVEAHHADQWRSGLGGGLHHRCEEQEYRRSHLNHG